MRHAFLLAIAISTTSACAPMYGAYPRAYPPMASRGIHAPHGPALQQAPPFGRWDQVMRLAVGTTVEVVTGDGQVRAGEKVAATIDRLDIAIESLQEQIARADVVRIDVLPAPGAEAGRVAARAAGRAAMAAAGMGAVAILLGGHGGVPTGRLLGAGAVGGAVYGTQEALNERGPRVIYLSPALRP